MRLPAEHELHDGDVLPYSAGALLVEDELPAVRVMLEELSYHARIPPPRLWIQDHVIPNAMTTGSSSAEASVTLSSGLLLVLDHRDVRAVLAHEIGHVAHGHVASKTSAALQLASRVGLVTAGAIGGAWVLAELLDLGGLGGLALQGLAAVIGGAAGNAAHRKLAQLGRSSELEADAFAAGAGGSPAALGSALRKLDVAMARLGGEMPEWQRVVSIVEPADQLATHPPTSERLHHLLPAAPPASDVLACPSCWFDEDAGVSHCRRCGTGLKARLCIACAARMHAADLACGQCGKMQPGDACWLCDQPGATAMRFCANCGAPQLGST